jgi:hypothetical protein
MFDLGPALNAIQHDAQCDGHDFRKLSKHVQSATQDNSIRVPRLKVCFSDIRELREGLLTGNTLDYL